MLIFTQGDKEAVRDLLESHELETTQQSEMIDVVTYVEDVSLTSKSPKTGERQVHHGQGEQGQVEDRPILNSKPSIMLFL